MSTINHEQILTDPFWDEEWATDWVTITEIFTTIENLEKLFQSVDVSVLRQLTQQKLILDLQHYAYSLSKVLEYKYQ